MSTPFQCVDCDTYPSIFQWNCPTEFCATVTRCSLINYKPPYCFLFFHTLPLFLCGLPHLFCFFSKWSCPTLVCVNVTQMLCVSSPVSLCECHTCASLFSLCECHTNILVSPLLLSGHATLVPFRSWLTHSRSNLVWTVTPHFLKGKFTRATFFLSFDNITNLFITTFICAM